jgi:hypothetical protein
MAPLGFLSLECGYSSFLASKLNPPSKGSFKSCFQVSPDPTTSPNISPTHQNLPKFSCNLKEEARNIRIEGHGGR